jgi:hypothetical protein
MEPYILKLQHYLAEFPTDENGDYSTEVIVAELEWRFPNFFCVDYYQTNFKRKVVTVKFSVAEEPEITNNPAQD